MTRTTTPTPTAPRRVVRPGILPSVRPRDWVPGCHVETLVPGRGVAVLLPEGRQAAVFLLASGMLYALDNLDPYGHAAVMSRGLTGDRAGDPTVASPLLKQVFSLRDGRALDDEGVRLEVFAVRVIHGVLHVGLERTPSAHAAA